MPKIYNQDLRDRAVNHWQKTGNKSQTAELNPIEQLWAVIKQKVRLTLSKFDTLKDCVESCLV
ncbi:hypothetical protein ENHY17A_110022 [Moraxellaceae bacterium 17A]|nr:hypothetical protein ENHY17A_110022 [Moraxellaceae bacterium 17A]